MPKDSSLTFTALSDTAVFCACLLIKFIYSRMSSLIGFHCNLSPHGEFVLEPCRVPTLPTLADFFSASC